MLKVDDLAVFEVAVLGCGGGGEFSGCCIGDGVGYLLDHTTVAGEADGDLNDVIEVYRAFIGD